MQYLIDNYYSGCVGSYGKFGGHLRIAKLKNNFLLQKLKFSGVPIALSMVETYSTT